MTIDKAPTAVQPHARSYGLGVRLGTHAHREAQLLFAARGVMQVTTPAGRWLVPPERAVWLPPRFEHAVDVLADIEMRTVYFDPSWLDPTLLASHDEAARLHRPFVVAVRPLLRQLILALFEPCAAARADLLARLILFEVAPAEDPATFIPLPLDARARRVAERLLADPADAPDLADLARAAGASARTITRLFQAETRLTFKAWRQRARIMAAVTQLGRGAGSIKQVAAGLGFSSPAAFAHAFRQVVGATPGEFLARSGAQQGEQQHEQQQGGALENHPPAHQGV